MEGPLREIGWAFSFARLSPLNERPRCTRTSQGELDNPPTPQFVQEVKRYDPPQAIVGSDSAAHAHEGPTHVQTLIQVLLSVRSQFRTSRNRIQSHVEGEDLLCWRGISGTLSHSIILGHYQVFLDSGSDPRAALAACCVLSHRPHQDGRAKIFWPGRYENGKKKEYTSPVRPLEDVTVPRKVAFHREAISQG